MNPKNYVSALVAITTFFLASSSIAQMRPDCFEDPAKPGSCFIDVLPGGAISCGFPNPENGAIQWFSAGEFNEKNQFGKINPSNPNGTGVVHNSARELVIGFCFWSDILAGNCSDTTVFPPVPLEGAYIGTASYKANGLVNAETGAALCPFVAKGKGMASNPNRGTMVEIDAVLHLVPDPSGDCRVKQCQILAPNQ